LILPLFGDAEQRWPTALRAVLYCLGLAWCFMGVAIIADIFMGAIETITSKRSRRFNSVTGRHHTVLTWNPTVANLTLMALGSSAPEILLNVVETVVTNKMFAGDLGPSTIVGSAAFNLLIIIAVCVSAIPDGEIRKIKEMPVYCVTAVCSIFAYVWLLLVLMVFTPNVVTPLEGILTFLFFPLLALIAFAADKGYFGGKPRSKRALGTLVTADMTKEELADIEVQIRKEYGSHITDEQVTKIINLSSAEANSRAHYRVAATRRMMGGKRVLVERMSASSRSLTDILGARSKVVPFEPVEEETPQAKCTIEFGAANYAVLENSETVKIKVIRKGILDTVVVVRYKTRDGTAKAQRKGEENADYIETEGSLNFGPGETEKQIAVSILDDNTYEEDEDFFVDIFDARVVSSEPLGHVAPGGKQPKAIAVLVDPSGSEGAPLVSTKVTIIDDDMAGTICWAKEEVHLQQTPSDTVCTFEVNRRNGSKGNITCKYRTENATAAATVDYEATEGSIEFEDNVCVAQVPVKILGRGRYGSSANFRVVLTDVVGNGAKFDPNTDGGEDSCILTVYIDADKVAMERVDKMMNKLMAKLDKAKIGHSSWKDQFQSALFVNGGEEEGSDGPAWQDYAMHVVSFPWKLIFACCPPTDYCGGWVCFCVSLLMIGGVTVIIGDMANLFGCVLPFMENEITAITFVALGTSLPDTFASKTAATQDPYADASVGNVTGSNSVNVFLGLGLPWMIASLYWSGITSHDEWDALYQEDEDLAWMGPANKRAKAYVVKAGSLAFSVMVFTGCAICCICILAARRNFLGGELGGPKASKYLTSAVLVFLWLLYIFMSILKIKNAV